MTPTTLMDTLQVVALLLVGAGATAVVRTRNRVRQVLALSVYGILLAILFLAFQAPDVTLSELTVGAVALPIVLLLAISKVHKRAEPAEPARPARPVRPARPDGKPER
jgi:energy-converting hydrogenase B subunit D